MTTFINNDVASGNIVKASDHNTQGALIANVLNGNIDTANIKDNSVTTAKIAPGSVTADTLAQSAVSAINTAFGSNVISSANPGTAGGTRNALNLGGFLIQWGRTANQSAPANSEISRGVTFEIPFSTTPTVIATIDTPSASVTLNYLIGNNVSTTSASWYWRNSSATAGVGGAASWIAIGKA